MNEPTCSVLGFSSTGHIAILPCEDDLRFHALCKSTHGQGRDILVMRKVTDGGHPLFGMYLTDIGSLMKSYQANFLDMKFPSLLYETNRA